MLMYEGLTGLFFGIIKFFSSSTFKNDGKNLLNHLSGSSSELIIFIVLITAYIFTSGFRNAYRVITKKLEVPKETLLIKK